MCKRLVQGKRCAGIWSSDFRYNNIWLEVSQDMHNFVQATQFKVAQYPGFLRLTNLEIDAGRLFAFLIC